MEEEWILSCLANELLVENKCVPFSEVEEEVRKLLRLRKRTHADNIRLAVLHEAMKDYLHGTELLKQQLENSQSYLSRILSWWWPRADAEESSPNSSSGASVHRRSSVYRDHRAKPSRGKKHSVKRTDPELWERVKKRVKAGSKGGNPGQWSARKAQLAVKMYKDRGGDYIGPKRKDNSLVIWTREEWDFVDGKKGNRYLPREVRKRLTPAEKRRTNRRKRSATRKGKQYSSYSPSVLRKYRKYSGSRS